MKQVENYTKNGFRQWLK